MTDIIKRMEEFYQLKELDEQNIEEISKYERDGEYVLATDEERQGMPMDARWDSHIHSTYHALILLLKYFNEGHDDVYDQLIRCYRKSVEFDFAYEGFMSLIATIELMKELLTNNIRSILDVKDLNDLEQIIDTIRAQYGNSYYKDEVSSLLEISDENMLFTYGTLMKGQSNHGYLKSNEYVGDAVLNNYALMEIGGFPGAIPVDSSWVTGELYRVDARTKKYIDVLEGLLYDYKRVIVEVDGKKYMPGFYEYKADEYGCYPVRPPYGKWDKNRFNPDDYVAYAVYGSNLSDKGISRYLNGYKPIDSRSYTIPHPLYFAKNSSRWDNMGVAFVDAEKEGSSYGWIYVVPKKVFEQIRDGEGRSWYDKVLTLGYDSYGIKIVTLTHSCRYDDNIPSSRYLDFIGYGLQEKYGLTDNEISEYLRKN